MRFEATDGSARAVRRHAALAAVLVVLSVAPQTLRAAAEWRAWESARVRIHVARIALLERVYRPSYGDVSAELAQEHANINDALRSLAAEQRPEPRLGVRIDAYLSAIDDSAQPFVRYLPPGWTPTNAAPLIVFLHGYSPTTDLFSLPYFPSHLTNAALRAGACIAVPFARGNTDFQGIGEQDVFRVMDEMRLRYGTDPRRVVLVGHSMGGMGAWCIAARHPQYFNAVMILAGRGDFYVWHKLKPEELPPWQRRLVDTQFASAWVHQLKSPPVLAVHGMFDTLVSFLQGKTMFDQLAPHNPAARFIALPEGDHWAPLDTLTNVVGTAWFDANLSKTNAPAFASRIRIGETGGHLQNALQQPFIFVAGTDSEADADAFQRLRARADEWQRFAHSKPRTAIEPLLNQTYAEYLNLFIFGEPESSPLIRRIFAANGVTYTPEALRIGSRTFPRTGNGLWFTAPNPFNTNRTAVVQCGIPWGAMIADNHRYDRIPDVMVYTADADFYGANVALAAGFIGAAGGIDWSEPATTPAITPAQPTPRLLNSPAY